MPPRAAASEKDEAGLPRKRSRRLRLRVPRRMGKGPGATPGIEPQELAQMASSPGVVRVTCIDYAAERSLVEDVTDFDAFLARHRPEWSSVRWINVDGLSDLKVVQGLSTKYHLHPLAVEDVLHVGQRPKVDAFNAYEEYQARLFIIARMVQMEGERLQSEQIGIFLGHKTVLTFQESRGDVWDPIRQRLETKGSRLRAEDASFLVHSLLDAIVDHCFPILERFGDRLEALEDLVLDKPDQNTVREMRAAKRDLVMLRHAVWPMREVVAALQRNTHECVSPNTLVYLRDVQDHVVQIIDIVEVYREVATGLNEAYMTAMSNRLNEAMKMLTTVGTIFIPVTFLAGVYGMNFHHMPELEWRGAYPSFWAACFAIAGGMVFWLKRRDWL
jgi:magnesium transporter